MAAMAFGGHGQSRNRPVHLSGTVRDGTGLTLPGARIEAAGQSTSSDASGAYSLSLPAGLVHIRISLPGQAPSRLTLDLERDRAFDITLEAGESVTVRAEQDALTPDPATQGFARADLLDANPGRPGVPLSLPGYPSETASGGVKAPQYFAPGVAGDHGEPIAQFFQIGGFLFPNNLTANAHGNGYSDPNPLIASTIGGLVIDNAAYNARYGDHSINLAVTYDVRGRLSSFIQAASDGPDGSLSAVWAPRDSAKREWLAAEALFGNGFLVRAEQRQQYKLNALRTWSPGRHELTAYALGYYGFSRIPGLIPIDAPPPGDTIDLRQLDLTHTSLALLADRWQLAERKVLSTGAYFRTYSLKLQSNFGDGLIRQSEFRTVQGANATYSQPLSGKWLLLAGTDLRRDAPRGLTLEHADAVGGLQTVTSNDLTITTVSPFAAVSGFLLPPVQLYLGIRRDQLHLTDTDLLQPANSFHAWPGVSSPKISLTFGKPDSASLPFLGLSYGKAFHANDPRIGFGTGRGDLIIQAHEFQLFAARQFHRSELRLTLAHITNSAELAKIDPDTGLQQDVGPSLNRFLTLAVKHPFPRGFLQLSWSEADARDRQLGSPIPEAPRMIVDAIGGTDRLPLGLAAKAEYGYVKAKPLGSGFTGVPLQEVRLALDKSFRDSRWQFSLNTEINNGYTGQTIENLSVGDEPAAFARPVGVPTRSYAAVSAAYFFGR